MRLKKVQIKLFSIVALMSIGIIQSQVNADEISLTEIEWNSATHGDATSSKTVQINQPFTAGNDGRDNKISLKMDDGNIRKFENGIGTVAANPSTISYDISSYNATSFSSYVGIDRTARPTDHRYAKVDKVEILVDNEVKFTTLTDYPDGINYDTPAIPLQVDIPAGAQRLELKSYSGQYTWGDEVVFADPKLTIPELSVTNPSETNEDPNSLPIREGSVYLSDLEWRIATHGDATSSKIVQKNKPFSLGNNGSNQKISLKMSDDSIKEFDKGLGTIAGSPSTIEYNIEGAEVSHFATFVGLDRSAGHSDNRYANIEKVEIEVDGEVIYSTLDEYPNGINYNTKAVKIDIEIPEDSRTFRLKSYAGAQTWGDEVVFAGAYFVAKGAFKNPNDFDPAPKRREISNTSPLLMMPLYANGNEYSRGNYAFWGGDTLAGKWENIDPELKPYTVIQIHPDDLPKRAGVAQQFYEHILNEAQNYINPQTGQNEPIPVMLTVYTAGNQPHYTAAHWIGIDWIDRMYERYSSLQGVFSTENYWVWAGDVESKAAEYLKLSAKHGGYFIWSEQNNGASIEKAMGAHGKTAFKEAVEKYWENFIFMYKNTPAHEGNDAPTASYMTGLWLADYAYQWGGLMDTWKWYETGKWKLFEQSSIGKTQGNRQWLTQPEAMLGAEAMNIYLNGGSVYNFEHPAYTYGVRNEESPLFSNVIETFFKYIIKNPAPSKEEVLANTKVVLSGNYSSKRDGHFFVDVNTATHQSPLYTTGRYGTLPAVPASISVDVLRSKLPETIQVLSLSSGEMSSAANRRNFLNALYPEEYTGNIFGDEIDNRVFIYNYEYNSDNDQTGSFELNGKEFDVTLKSHSFTIVEETDSGLHILLNNYRINKDSLWEGATDATSARALPQLSKPDAIDWVYNNYIHNTANSEQRQTVFVLKNVKVKPTIEILKSTDSDIQIPQIEFDEETKTARITVVNNGFAEFLIRY
ncbi:beta-galactosidase [Streptococcus suis]|nr:beta-galactosidase [Streptococcus suis]HEM4270297.1 NPCBM/NEW2 domain-containing protein [Streptococcus suis]